MEELDEETKEDLEELVEETVKEEVKKLRGNKNNSITVHSHDISVNINSSEADLDQMVEFANEMMAEREKQALIGEYQVLEESENIFQILGD